MRTDDGQEVIFSFHASEIVYSEEELTGFAELIVLGTTGTGNIVSKKPSEIPDYPADLKKSDSELIHDIKIIPFTVNEYIKGEGPAIIDVAIDGNTVRPLLHEETYYLLYLEKPESESDQAYFENAYLPVTGRQGVWKVHDGIAFQQFTDEKSVDLYTLKDMQESSVLRDIENIDEYNRKTFVLSEDVILSNDKLGIISERIVRGSWTMKLYQEKFPYIAPTTPSISKSKRQI